MHYDNGVTVDSGNGLDQCVASMPGIQVISVTLLVATQFALVSDVPVTFVALDSDIVLSRVGIDEDNGHIFSFGSSSCSCQIAITDGAGNSCSVSVGAGGDG